MITIPTWAVGVAAFGLALSIYCAWVFFREWVTALDELTDIKWKRSQATRLGNLTRAANRRAKQDRITEKLRENHAQ